MNRSTTSSPQTPVNGSVSWTATWTASWCGRELPKQLKKRLVQGFKTVDRNGDGGLDIEEFIAMRRLGQQRAAQASVGSE